MFDFDGTVTEKGQAAPEKEMAGFLTALAEKMPIAFCTGRQLESFERHGLEALIKAIDPEKLEPFLENLFLIAENGAIGYAFNTELDRFEEFYCENWPNSFISRPDLKTILQEKVKDFGYVHDDLHRRVIVIRTVYTGTREVKKTYEYSAKIRLACIEVLKEIDPDFEDYLHVGDSGIGVVICPADADKNNGIRRFGEYLREKKSFEFDDNFREILVIGDRHQEGGNDYYFLNGQYGTPYTVGDAEVTGAFPKKVYDENENQLFNAEGTKFLIEKVLART